MNPPESTTSKVVNTLYSFRRPCTGEDARAPGDYSPDVFAKVGKFIENNEPIHIIIPAFPCKSVVPEKTLNLHPDKSEELSIRHLQGICKAIKSEYEPGATITIYSDGGVFANTLKGLALDGSQETTRPQYTDEARVEYLKGLQKMVSDMGASDVIKIETTEGARGEDILQNHSENIETIKERSQSNPDLAILYSGIKGFFSKEVQAINPGLSKSKSQKVAKEKAYEVVQSSDAMSRWLDANDSEAVRVSVHPKPLTSSKIGIYMDPGKSEVTPWHGAAALVNRPDEYSIMHAEKASKLGLDLVHDKDGKPSHFEIPESLNKAIVGIQSAIRGHLARRNVPSRAEQIQQAGERAKERLASSPFKGDHSQSL